MKNNIFRSLLDIIYPTRCILCRRTISAGRPDICPRCQNTIPRPPASGRKGDFFSSCVSALYYEGPVRSSILRFKFSGARSYAHALGEQTAVCVYENHAQDYDILTWVPIDARRRRHRGYDQTELIARVVSQRLCRPLTPTLKKKGGVAPQSKTGSPERRRANIAGAYTVLDPAAIRGQKILLIDDIVTSGSTLSEAAKTLLLAGADNVICATLATVRY